MSNEDLEQTLILKEDKDVDIDAETIRNYLIIRDEAIAVNQVAEIDDLTIISEEEARIVYQQAIQEIKARGENRWLDFFKTYGAGALIGGLAMAVVFLLFVQPPATQTPANISTNANLNYEDYRILKSNEAPGSFPNMLLIAGGEINNGCTKGWDDEPSGCRISEFPSRRVSVKTFEISQYETTVGQFSQFVESTQYKTDAEKNGEGCVHKDVNSKGHPFLLNPELSWRAPGYKQDNTYPVACVSWHDAQEYIKWLSAETKTTYRLPTETEWEYAARGGQSTAYFWGSQANHNQANYSDVGGQDQWEFASPVGRFPANKLGVQDAAGNLWEWVQDCWHNTYDNAPKDGSAWVLGCDATDVKVRRGGGWDANAAGIRSAIRSPGAVHDRSNLYGFRVARDWQKPNN